MLVLWWYLYALLSVSRFLLSLAILSCESRVDALVILNKLNMLFAKIRFRKLMQLLTVVFVYLCIEYHDLIKGESAPVDNLPILIVILVGVVFVMLFLIDISCYRINKSGIIWSLTNRMCNKKKSRESLVKDATIQ